MLGIHVNFIQFFSLLDIWLLKAIHQTSGTRVFFFYRHHNYLENINSNVSPVNCNEMLSSLFFYLFLKIFLDTTEKLSTHNTGSVNKKGPAFEKNAAP